MADDRMVVLETVRKAMADEAKVSELTGVPRGKRDPDARLTHRNGYRERRWDTRVGTIDLAVPRVRDGSYLPSLLDPRRRTERALLAVVQEAYVSGVSTRRVDDLVRALGIEGMSRSEVVAGRSALLPTRDDGRYRCCRDRRGEPTAAARELIETTQRRRLLHHVPGLDPRGGLIAAKAIWDTC